MPWYGIVISIVAGTWVFVTLLSVILWGVLFRKIWKDGK
jgi:hypothetical protein